MSATPAPEHPHIHRPDFWKFDRMVGHVLGVDMRLLYGMAVPILVIVGLLVVLAFHPHSWVVAIIVAIEVVALGIVVSGIFSVMDHDGPEDSET